VTGETFLGVALFAAGAIIFLAGRARRRRASPKFPAAFVPHATVQLTLRRQASPIQGRQHGIFAIGRNGFSVRFDAPALQPGVPQRVEVEFLKPELARAHFVPGAAFSMVDGAQLLADGEVLGQNEVHEPGQG
jgi:hypothetical protein